MSDQEYASLMLRVCVAGLEHPELEDWQRENLEGSIDYLKARIGKEDD